MSSRKKGRPARPDDAARLPDRRIAGARMARVRREFAPLLARHAAGQARDFTEVVNEAVRLYLEGLGLWPPAPADLEQKLDALKPVEHALAQAEDRAAARRK